MNAPNEDKIEPNKQIREFISDIAPIFRGRQVFIADVGAHIGSTFSAFYNSQLKVNRACLFEANPGNFARLEHCVADLDATSRATCLNIAVSDQPRTVRLRDMQDMSRIVGSGDKEAKTDDEQVIEVAAKPLDSFQELFPDGHISILKVDVEGHELEVFRGASSLLAAHAVEVVYVEAGADRDNPQQSHYRDVEDILYEHGYRLFKIYEQTMEWVDDRPLLRRMNLAFVSPVVAAKYPYSLLQELARQDVKLSEQAQLRQDLAETTAKLHTAHKELADLAQAFHKIDPDIGLEGGPNGLAGKLESAERRVRDLERSTSWRITAPVRKLSDKFRRR